VTIIVLSAFIINKNTINTISVLEKRINSSLKYSISGGYDSNDIVDGEWNEDMLSFIIKDIPDKSMVCFSNQGTSEVAICFKDINVFCTANATPNEELYNRQNLNSKIFDGKLNNEYREGIISKNSIDYLVITPSYYTSYVLYKNFTTIYNKNGYAIVKIR